ncbi:MAG: protein kinase domain-containing protein [Phycisphaerales bacterium]
MSISTTRRVELSGAPGTAEVDLRVPASIHGFQVLRRLGRGAASTLYAVYEPATRQVHTLKHVVRRPDRDREDQRFLDQAENEFAIASEFDHPGVRAARRIVRIRPFLKVSEILLLLDFVDGTPLDQLAHASAGSTLRRYAAAARSLGHLHANGVVHADFKPGNIVVTEAGEVVVIDFGQACRIGTRKPRIQGTPGYMAPEQRRLDPLGPEVDAFALGASILRTFCGEEASAGSSAGGSGSGGSAAFSALADLTADPAKAIDTLRRTEAPAGLEECVAAMLNPDVSRRPGNLMGIAQELDSLADRV